MPLADVHGTTINFRLDGPERGPVVMFSNSLAADLTMWDAQVPALIAAGYRVFRYDSRGHGQSAAPTGPYSIALLASDAVGLMDALGLEQVHFCGLSMGGMVGQALGAHHGGRLMSLTLSSTSAYMPLREIWDERIETVRKDGLLPEIEKVRRVILNMSVEGYCACCEAIRELDLRDALKAISTRTLVIVGEQDPGTPVSSAEFIHERIASSTLRVIPNAAHFVNVEQADRFNDALLDFLEMR
jgi:3-oxoadipate enol-lactonase